MVKGTPECPWAAYIADQTARSAWDNQIAPFYSYIHTTRNPADELSRLTNVAIAIPGERTSNNTIRNILTSVSSMSIVDNKRIADKIVDSAKRRKT